MTQEVTWFESGGVDIKVGMLLDGPAVMMLLVVTTVSLLVHVYSTDYVGGDRRYTHFFAFLSLFTASMLGLVIAKSTLQLIVMWELVGVCSFVLIGHWWEEKANSDAALKAFITNRVGDVGLIIGVILLFWTVGSFDILETNAAALDGSVGHSTLLIASCCLIAAVMSKSGQFILHTWLPDAMAGPTPVSALIHAATMVVAGIYLVARLYAVFFEGLSIGTSSVNLLAVVGAVTVIGGAGAGLRPGRHQEGARLLHDLPAGLHGDGAGHRGLDRGALPPLHPRLLQGVPVPRLRLGEPRRPLAST